MPVANMFTDVILVVRTTKPATIADYCYYVCCA